MIRLKKLSLREFQHFSSLDLEFHPRMNLIVGPNGSGKSTVLRGIKGALLGLFDARCNKDVTVRTSAAKRTSAYVELEFDCNSCAVVVRRSLRSGKDRLTLGDGSDAIEGFSEVNRHILQLANASKFILDDFVFGDQGEIDSVLKGTKSQRQGALAKLFGIERLAKVHDALRKKSHAATPTVSIPEIEQQLHEANASKEAWYLELQRLQYELTTYVDVKQWPAHTDPDLLINTAYSRKEEMINEIGTIEASLIDLEKSGLTVSAEYDSVCEDLQEFTGALSLQSPDVERARVALARWQQYKSTSQHITRIDRELESLSRDVWVEPSQPMDYVSIDQRGALTKQKKDLTDQISTLNTLVQFWSNKECCPTCGQPQPEDVRHSLTSAVDNIQTLTRTLKDISSVLNTSEAFDRVLGERNRWQQNHAQRVATLVSSKESIVSSAPPEISEAEVAALLADHQGMVEYIGHLDSRKAHIKSNLNSLRADYKSMSQRLTHLQHEVSLCHLTGADKELALMRYNERNKRMVEKTRLEANLETASTNFHHANNRLEYLTQVFITTQRSQKVSATLGFLADLFAKDALPSRISATGLEKLTRRVGDFLFRFDSSFRIRVDPERMEAGDLGFTVDKADGTTHPAELLSGGQLMTLALSYRCAVNSSYASDVGLMCMDEPTVFLDDTNVSNLEQALGRLRDLAGATGLQVVIVTHHTSLARCFDHVIDLSR